MGFLQALRGLIGQVDRTAEHTRHLPIVEGKLNGLREQVEGLENRARYQAEHPYSTPPPTPKQGS